MSYDPDKINPSSFTHTVDKSVLSWAWGWGDWDTGGHDWNINYTTAPAGWGLISDAMRRDGGHPLPCCGNFLLVNANTPIFAKPCTGYALVHTFPTGEGMRGRRLWLPTHTDPQYIGVGICVDRADMYAAGAGSQPPLGRYYCINKSFLQDVGQQVMPDCSDGNCDKNGLRLNRAIVNHDNITIYRTYKILPYDIVLAGCKGTQKINAPWDISNTNCSSLLSLLYDVDDIKTGKADFCAYNSGWCDKTIKDYCKANPNHSSCDCINTADRPAWKEIDKLLLPTVKRNIACISPFCVASRMDVLKTSDFIVDSHNCPDIKYIDQSIKVDGYGNIIRSTQTASVEGDKTVTSDSDSTTNNIKNENIMGISSTMFYILLFLFIVVIIVVSMKYGDDEPKRVPQPEPAPVI